MKHKKKKKDEEKHTNFILLRKSFFRDNDDDDDDYKPENETPYSSALSVSLTRRGRRPCLNAPPLSYNRVCKKLNPYKKKLNRTGIAGKSSELLKVLSVMLCIVMMATVVIVIQQAVLALWDEQDEQNDKLNDSELLLSCVESGDNAGRNIGSSDESDKISDKISEDIDLESELELNSVVNSNNRGGSGAVAVPVNPPVNAVDNGRDDGIANNYSVSLGNGGFENDNELNSSAITESVVVPEHTSADSAKIIDDNQTVDTTVAKISDSSDATNAVNAVNALRTHDTTDTIDNIDNTGNIGNTDKINAVDTTGATGAANATVSARSAVIFDTSEAIGIDGADGTDDTDDTGDVVGAGDTGSNAGDTLDSAKLVEDVKNNENDGSGAYGGHAHEEKKEENDEEYKEHKEDAERETDGRVNFFIQDGGFAAVGSKLDFMTVGEALEKSGIELGEYDVVNYPLDYMITESVTIEIDRIKKEYKTISEELMYDTKIVEVDTIPINSTKVVQSGAAGETLKYYECLYLNDEITDEIFIREETKDPVEEILYKGVGGTFTAPDGTVYNYSHVIDVEATAYGDVSEGTNPDWTGITFSGMECEPGVIAVDPSVIPLLSKIYVTGDYGDYGECIAADTGSAIKGNKIDIYMESKDAMIEFGRRRMKVYVLM